MTEVNAELVMYRLDELKRDTQEIKDSLREHVVAADKRDAAVESRVKTLEQAPIEAAKASGSKQGAVTGGVVGAAVVLLTYAAEWARSRFGG